MTDPQALSRLMVEIRPRLHRYCARMVGSVFEGEDIVQEALAKATEVLPAAGGLEKAESWLFTIAHNTALDALRPPEEGRPKCCSKAIPPSYRIRLRKPSPGPAPRRVSATLDATSPLQRSTWVLVDVLEYSLALTVEILGTTLLSSEGRSSSGKSAAQSDCGGGRALAAVVPAACRRAGTPARLCRAF